ncbi:hypothetical protein ACJW30_07G099500 [Castanea mollissima]
MAKESRQLHIFFFPLMAHGHQIPTMDMAKLFAERGVRATIVTTPRNVPFFSIIRSTNNVDIQIIKFPAVEAGLPEGSSCSEQLVQDLQPNCLVADMFFPWATDIAAKFGIPRLIFHGTCFFSLCANHSMGLYEPYKKVSSDFEPFVIPNFPGEIKFTRMQLPDFTRQEVETDFSKLFKEVMESELRSYGAVVNSFYELEPAYAEHYKKTMGRKAWHIGPVSLCNKEAEDKAKRGKEASIDEHECLKWLATRKPNSVVYVCFGSIANFSDSQLMEIAMGLEASGQQFIWVVRKGKNEKEEEDWLPKGFEKRMESKGLIVRAVGGFVTHCGWNSILEGVSAGVPMVTWPMGAEQFYNEKLVTHVLKIGVDVCAHQWTSMVGDGIKRESLKKATRGIMVGEEAEEMRGRAKVFGKMARRAVEEGGSSYSDLNALIEELSLHCH